MRTLIYYVFAVFLPLCACQDQLRDFRPDRTSTTSVSSNLLESKLFSQAHGWLQFKSKDAFNATMKMLHDSYQPNQLREWESHVEGFTSLRATYEKIDADRSEDRRAPTVDSLINANKLLYCPDSHFATVLSKDGYIQIADTIYSFRPGKEKALAIPARYQEAIVKGIDPSGLKGVQTHRVFIQLIPLPFWPDGNWTVEPIKEGICDFPSSNMLNWWGQRGGYIYGANNGQLFPEHNGRTVRLRYERWRVGYVVYASAGIRLKMQKHTRFAGWQSVTNAEEMVMEACLKGNLVEPTGIFPFQTTTSPAWPGFRKLGTNKFEKTLKWVGNGVFAEILLDHFNFHFRVNYRGRIAERYIRE